MLSFEWFLRDVAEKGEAVNIMFEERLFRLVGILNRITQPLMAEDVSHEVIGGFAVLIHVEAADPERSILTRDVDLMIRRSDLDRVKEIASRHGFRFRHADGGDMLTYVEAGSRKSAVHLVYSGDKIGPPIEPALQTILGCNVFVIRVPDLVRMKLSSYRLKDQLHIQSMDAAGLITPDIEKELSAELLSRLARIRELE
jgi:hypothetical protein